MTTKAEERAAFATIQLAAAAVAAKGGSAEARELAEAVLRETRDDLEAGRIGCEAENGTIADEFNRQMDAVLDATNRSRKASDRAARRAALARDLDRAGLVLLDRDTVSAMFAKGLELDLAREQLERLKKWTEQPAPRAADYPQEIAGEWPPIGGGDYLEPEAAEQDPGVND